MNSHQDYIGGLFGSILFVIILHYTGKSFLKDKLKRKEEFEKFVAENGNLPKFDYNNKKYLMNSAEVSYRNLNIVKWFMIMFTFISIYKLIS